MLETIDFKGQVRVEIIVDCENVKEGFEALAETTIDNKGT